MWVEDKHSIGVRENRIKYHIGPYCEDLAYGLCEKVTDGFFIRKYRSTKTYGKVKNPHEKLGVTRIRPFNYEERGLFLFRLYKGLYAVTTPTFRINNALIPREIGEEILSNQGYTPREIKEGKVFWEAEYVREE